MDTKVISGYCFVCRNGEHGPCHRKLVPRHKTFACMLDQSLLIYYFPLTPKHFTLHQHLCLHYQQCRQCEIAFASFLVCLFLVPELLLIRWLQLLQCLPFTLSSFVTQVTLIRSGEQIVNFRVGLHGYESKFRPLSAYFFLCLGLSLFTCEMGMVMVPSHRVIVCIVNKPTLNGYNSTQSTLTLGKHLLLLLFSGYPTKFQSLLSSVWLLRMHQK